MPFPQLRSVFGLHFTDQSSQFCLRSSYFDGSTKLFSPHNYFQLTLSSKIIKHQPNSYKQEILEGRDLVSDVLSRACELIAGEQLMELPHTGKDEDNGCLPMLLISRNASCGWCRWGRGRSCRPQASCLLIYHHPGQRLHQHT